MGTTTQAGNLATQLGASALGSIVGEGIGLLFNGVNNANQLKQQGALDAQQLQYNEQMSAYNYGQQYQLWQETNYPNQVNELNQAGLNPALLYGMHGGGGATTGIPSGGIQGAQAPSVSSAQTAQLAIQSQDMLADANLKNAEANNLNAKTPQEAPLMNAQTASLTQGVQNQQAVEALTQMQTTAQGIQNAIQGQTMDDQIAKIRAAATQIESEAQQAVRNNYIDQQTMDNKIKIVQGQMIGTFIQNQLMTAQTGTTEEQAKQIAASIAQKWQSLGIDKQNANTAEGQLKIQQMVQDIPHSQQIIMQGLTKLIPSLILGI